MKEQNSLLDFDRITYLLNPEQFADKRITIVGLGSGGTPVCDHLVMNGIRIWELYDPDSLETENLVKHPRMRKDLGRLKVDIQNEWIEDRNPNAEVEAFAEDVMKSTNFIESVRRSHYLGSWHTHHCNGLTELSPGDIKSYKETLNSRDYDLNYFFALLVTDVR